MSQQNFAKCPFLSSSSLSNRLSHLVFGCSDKKRKHHRQHNRYFVIIYLSIYITPTSFGITPSSVEIIVQSIKGGTRLRKGEKGVSQSHTALTLFDYDFA
jgi:hypothetical protein